MSLREEDSIVRQVRDILLDIDELKTRQFVGDSQIIVRHYATEPVNFTTQEQTEYLYEFNATCTVTGTDLLEGNVLLSYCIPEIRYHGELVDFTQDPSPHSYTLSRVMSDDPKENKYQLFYADSSISEEPISYHTYQVVFHIYSASSVEISIDGA